MLFSGKHWGWKLVWDVLDKGERSRDTDLRQGFPRGGSKRRSYIDTQFRRVAAERQSREVCFSWESK